MTVERVDAAGMPLGQEEWKLWVRDRFKEGASVKSIALTDEQLAAVRRMAHAGRPSLSLLLPWGTLYVELPEVAG